VPEIYLDGEPVQFEGSIPSSLQDLLAVVEHNLAAAQRVVAGVLVDGSQSDGSLSGEAYVASRRIDFSTMSIEAAIEQVAAGCRQSATELAAQAEGLAALVLRETWDVAARELVAFGERLAGLLDGLGGLEHVPEFASLVADLSAALNRWMDSISTHEAGDVCLSLERDVLAVLQRIASSGSGRVDPA